MIINLLDLLLERGLLQARHGEHRSGYSLAILDCRLDNRLRKGQRRKSERTLKANLEEDRKSMQGVLIEFAPVPSGSVLPRYNSGRNDTLGVARRAFEERSEFGRTQVGSFSEDDVLGELGESDQRERDGAGGEVGHGRAGGRILEPVEEGEGVRSEEVRGARGGAELGEVRRGESEERDEERRVERVEGLSGLGGGDQLSENEKYRRGGGKERGLITYGEFVKVDFVHSLASEESVELGIARERRRE